MPRKGASTSTPDALPPKSSSSKLRPSAAVFVSGKHAHATTLATSVKTLAGRRPREAEVEARAAQRASDKAAKLAKGDALKDSGNEFFRAQNYEEALNYYSAATVVDPTRPVYACNMAAAQLRLGEYEEAEESANLALRLDPLMIKARYRRGLARKGQGLLACAILDFEAMLEQDPACADAEGELAVTRAAWEAGDGIETGRSDAFDAYPLPGDMPEPVDEDSDSEDAQHVGNYRPCKHYNRNGCSRGSRCAFIHAPDGGSVRDDLGRNVCCNFLIDDCKYGAQRCFYSHSREYLPKDGFWNNPEAIVKVKEVINEQKKQASSAGEIFGKGNGKAKGKAKAPPARRQEFYDSDSDNSDEIEERMMNGGFTDDEVMELACQGVKPWDDDAHAVLDVIYGRSGYY